MFTVNAKLNRGNECWLAFDHKEVPIAARTKSPETAHLFGVGSS